ncbi:hypothetical protein H6G81_12760 [Scytonema hofmannii FACHB-248]|uniref:Uncharacterized protein n=1 Tax=Scytonema hofmannii FACHB-248 TaxID=1842502 RepID=A0ABR8GPL1_9CYAN|nr:MULTISPECIES: hypothetical protein [Nostocales]MBD2605381.1 hypothetical protein [Scytonema hofmannii FACHB-248]
MPQPQSLMPRGFGHNGKLKLAIRLVISCPTNYLECKDVPVERLYDGDERTIAVCG